MALKPSFNQDRIPFALATMIIVCISALALGYYRHTLEQKVLSGPIPVLSQASCGASGGTWNACGSLCRALPAGTACPAICVEQCECKVNDDCPYEYSCGSMVNGTGVCSIDATSIDKK